MELDLQNLFGLHVHSWTHWLRPRNPPPFTPRIWAHIYMRALLVSQDRRHLFLTPWWEPRGVGNVSNVRCLSRNVAIRLYLSFEHIGFGGKTYWRKIRVFLQYETRTGQEHLSYTAHSLMAHRLTSHEWAMGPKLKKKSAKHKILIIHATFRAASPNKAGIPSPSPSSTPSLSPSLFYNKQIN